MLKKIFFIFLIFNSVVLVSSEKGKLVLSERASFRIGNDIYYQSEVNNIEKKIKMMNCVVGGESLLLKKIFYFDKLKKNKSILEVVFLTKLENYLKELKFEVHSLLLKKLVVGNMKNCGIKFEKILQDRILLSMVYGEIFFQENFYINDTNQLGDFNPDTKNKRWNGFVGLIHSKYVHYVYD